MVSHLNKHDQVDAATKDDCQTTIDPEQHIHGGEQPFPRLARRETILGDVEQYRSDADDAGWYEKRLGRMKQRMKKCRGVEVKS